MGEYNPIVAGSIDGTDTQPHDNAIKRACVAISEGKFKPLLDPKIKGDPHKTLFVYNLNYVTSESTLQNHFIQYGHVVRVQIVRCVATGISRGYAFVEFKHSSDYNRALQSAHKAIIDDRTIFVEEERGRLIRNWIPRRLGGGIGGRKESGQLRFGGRNRQHKRTFVQGPSYPRRKSDFRGRSPNGV
eukprot:c11490_g1_i1.p1 GENE.c11490_g1_i1~~c11490_g1_i1.p1  ORF type:complete len:204 (-),score=24.45 c11490_g1_i1:83-643(-)